MTSTNWGEIIQEAKAGGASFEPIPDGDYDFVVTKAEVKQTQNGKTMYVLENTVSGGPHNGRKVWARLIVSPENPNALGYFFRDMAALGLSTEFFGGNPSDNQITSSLQNVQFRAQVGLGREFNGRTDNEIKKFYSRPAGGAPQAPTFQPQQGAPAPAPQYGAPQQQAPQYQQAPQQQAPAPAPAPQAPQQSYQQPPQQAQAPAPAPAPANPWNQQAGGLPQAPEVPF